MATTANGLIRDLANTWHQALGDEARQRFEPRRFGTTDGGLEVIVMQGDRNDFRARVYDPRSGLGWTSRGDVRLLGRDVVHFRPMSQTRFFQHQRFAHYIARLLHREERRARRRN